MSVLQTLRLGFVFPLVAMLAACAGGQATLEEEPVPLGDFLLGHNIVLAENAQMAPISRRAEPEEWVEALMLAMDERFGRYDGDHYYNIGISVDGFALAPPGLPVIASPKSVLIITVTVWDDETQEKLNEEVKQLTVFETLDGNSIIGTGLTKSREEQLQTLAQNAAFAIQNWMVENPQWFGIVSSSSLEADAAEELPDEEAEALPLVEPPEEA
ncbi:hypothetical protein [Cochlodiniinecator piscidefendens]|uniref:hypothetical protein n=1 Tax=Cochlodiniinecator piscidefendens TaxID=2715756 RepID=UPI00197BD1AB|nr:hypothetical protein [Cochlodiniinecator piscidefendens]